MNPLVGKVNLNAVDVVHLLVFVKVLHLLENSVYIGVWSKVDTVLGNEIWRIGCTKFAHLHLLVCQVTEEQGDSNKGIASVMAFWIDNSAISLSADNSVCLLHLCCYVNLANGSGIVFAAVLACHVSQSAC